MYNHNKAQQSKNRVHISWDNRTKAGKNVVYILPGAKWDYICRNSFNIKQICHIKAKYLRNRWSQSFRITAPLRWWFTSDLQILTTKSAVMRSFDGSFVVGPNKMLNKKPNCRWFEIHDAHATHCNGRHHGTDFSGVCRIGPMSIDYVIWAFY